MPEQQLIALGSRDQVLAARPGDVFVRYTVSPTLSGPAFRLGEALLFSRVGPRGLGLIALGPPDDLDQMLRQVQREGLLVDVPITHITVPTAAERILPTHFEIGPGGDWEWMWTTSPPPPMAAEERVVDLDIPRDRDQAAALLAIGNTRASLLPDDPKAEAWVGIYADDSLIACAAAERTAGGAAHLGSIAVHPEHRRLGLGAAVTAAMTRRYVQTEGICTLGMYSDNDTARRLYLALGYHDDYWWCSRTVRQHTPG